MDVPAREWQRPAALLGAARGRIRRPAQLRQPGGRWLALHVFDCDLLRVVQGLKRHPSPAWLASKHRPNVLPISLPRTPSPTRPPQLTNFISAARPEPMRGGILADDMVGGVGGGRGAPASAIWLCCSDHVRLCCCAALTLLPIDLGVQHYRSSGSPAVLHASRMPQILAPPPPQPPHPLTPLVGPGEDAGGHRPHLHQLPRRPAAGLLYRRRWASSGGRQWRSTAAAAGAWGAAA